MDLRSVSSETNRDATKIATESFPSSLAAPVGWRSEIVSKFDDEKDFLTKNSVQTISNENFENLSYDQKKPPLIVHRKLSNNLVTYKQNVSLRFLRAPTPPPPGPLIIREVRPPPPPPRSPIKIVQRPPAAKTPPPLVFREKPPPTPEPIPEKVVEKVLPPAAPGPAQVVIERFGAPPPKPPNVIFERWLPYKKPPARKILIERAPPIEPSEEEKDLLILYDPPESRIHREFLNQGVVRVDPDDYLSRYSGQIDHRHQQYADLLDEAMRKVPPPTSDSFSVVERRRDFYYDDDRYDYYNRYRRVRSPYFSRDFSDWDYFYPRSRFCRSPRFDCVEYRRYCYDYPTIRRCSSRDLNFYPSTRTFRRSRYCDSYPTYCSTPVETIRVRSEDEFRRVICDLTDGRFEPNQCAY